MFSNTSFNCLIFLVYTFLLHSLTHDHQSACWFLYWYFKAVSSFKEQSHCLPAKKQPLCYKQGEVKLGCWKRRTFSANELCFWRYFDVTLLYVFTFNQFNSLPLLLALKSYYLRKTQHLNSKTSIKVCQPKRPLRTAEKDLQRQIWSACFVPCSAFVFQTSVSCLHSSAAKAFENILFPNFIYSVLFLQKCSSQGIVGQLMLSVHLGSSEHRQGKVIICVETLTSASCQQLHSSFCITQGLQRHKSLRPCFCHPSWLNITVKFCIQKSLHHQAKCSMIETKLSNSPLSLLSASLPPYSCKGRKIGF